MESDVIAWLLHLHRMFLQSFNFTFLWINLTFGILIIGVILLMCSIKIQKEFKETSNY